MVSIDRRPGFKQQPDLQLQPGMADERNRLSVRTDSDCSCHQAAREVESLAANEAHETSAMAQREALELKLTIEKAAMRLEMLTGERGIR